MKTPNKTIALTLLSFTNSLAFVPDRNLPVRHMARANKNSRALSILASTVFDESEFQGEFQPAQRLSNMFKEDIGAIQIDGRPLPLMGSSNGVLPLPISTKLNIYCLIERLRKQKTNTYYSQRQKIQLLDLIIRKMIQLKEQYNPTKHQVQRGPGPGSRLNVYGEEVTFTHLISVLNELSEVDENCKVMLNKHITQNLRANTVVFAYMYYALENAKLYNDESEHLTFCEQCVDLSIRSLKEPDILTPGYINELKKCVEKVLCAIIKEDIKEATKLKCKASKFIRQIFTILFPNENHLKTTKENKKFLITTLKTLVYYGQPFTSSLESAIKLTRCLKQYEDDSEITSALQEIANYKDVRLEKYSKKRTNLLEQLYKLLR